MAKISRGWTGAAVLGAIAMVAGAGAIAQRPVARPAEASFGSDPKQRLDLYLPVDRSQRRPLIVFIHGGGWAIGDKRHAIGLKADHFGKSGHAIASVNYRLVPAARVEDQATDIATAIAWLRRNAAPSGYDGNRIVLMGHSAGAHLAALVATDPAYLEAAGVPLASIEGVVLLDGADYDVPAQMTSARNLASGMYNAAFGKYPARQRALSPTHHAAAPNAANWLILPIERRADSTAQSKALAAALVRAGARASVVPVPGETHRSLNVGLGEAGDFATAKVDAFLASL